jgi:hypothetical protein
MHTLIHSALVWFYPFFHFLALYCLAEYGELSFDLLSGLIAFGVFHRIALSVHTACPLYLSTMFLNLLWHIILCLKIYQLVCRFTILLN